MKTLGIVGGIGPESTIDYYRHLVARHRERAADSSYPSVLINSIEAQRTVGLINAGDLAALTQVLVAATRQLARGGADVGLIAANTPHLVFDAVAQASPIPLISIVEATRDAAQLLGMRRVGLFGTRFTMSAGFYQKRFAESAIEVVVPEPEEQDFIHAKYMGELFLGRFLPETREGLVAIIAAMKARSSIEGIILGGTELPLILQESSYDGVVVLNTTQIHVEAALDRILG